MPREPTTHSTPHCDATRWAGHWRLDRRINLSVLVQLVLLASLILTSWLNLQRQLDLLQHDVTMLLDTQEHFQQKLERLSERSLSCEYRLRALEKDRTDRTNRTHAADLRPAGFVPSIPSVAAKSSPSRFKEKHDE